MSRRRANALVAMGSNLGDRRGHLDAAVDSLRSTPGVEVRAVSTYHATAPAGGPEGQDRFLNAAVLVSTKLDPRALLDVLHVIEDRSGRVREARWGPRVLDLDLILHGKARVEEAALTVPHPRMAVRRFVLAPAAEVAPRMVDPRTGRTLRDLLRSLDRRPSYLAVVAPPGPGRAELLGRLRDGLDPELVRLDRRGGDELLAAGSQPGESPGFDRQFAEANDALAPGRHEPFGDACRWVASDFWIDQFLVGSMLRHASTTCRLLPFSDAFEAARGTLLAPTLVAFWDPPAGALDAHLFGVCDGGMDGGGPGSGRQAHDHHRSNWLRLRRAYDDYLWTDRVRNPVLRLSHPDPAAAAAEILAACRASRPS